MLYQSRYITDIEETPRQTKALCSYRRNHHNVKFPQTNQTVCGNFHFTSRINDLAKPSPVGEGGSRRLTDEVLSHRLKIGIIQLKMLQNVLCNGIKIIPYIVVRITQNRNFPSC